MSNFTDHAENRLADMWRGQAWALPSSLYVGLASDAGDGSITELAGTDYARQPAPRTLPTWAGTQGPGTTLASSGTSKATSNNVAFTFSASAGSAWGTATHGAIFDAATGGNALVYLPLPAVMVINTGDPVSIGVGALSGGFDTAGAISDYLANKLIDFILRGQAFSFPGSAYCALMTGAGAELVGDGYARVAVPCSLAAWSGTQGAGSTTASTGSSGQTSNNAAITFPAATATWTTAGRAAMFDASAAGNMLLMAPLAVARDINAGGPPASFDPGAFIIEWA